jgi:hypothetical protein
MAIMAIERGPLGCTHLNDMLRALADVPVLAGRLLAVDHRRDPIYINTWKTDYRESR